MKSLMMPLKGLRKRIPTDSVGFFRVITLILLSLSLLVVLIGWFEFKDSTELMIPIEQKLAVPLMVFGVIAIISILLFTKPGLPMFLAIAIVAYVVGGEALSKQVIDLFAGNNTPYAANTGGIGSSQYGLGGVKNIPSESQ